MDVNSYLERIGYSRLVKPDVDTLHGLHYVHLLSIPFENLDIRLGNPISLDERALWDKIVVRKRGGFCYELNGLFAWLLKQIGYEVTYLNGRVYNDDGEYGREFDHLTLMVGTAENSARWLADVGFGDSFLWPLKMNFSEEQAQGLRTWRLEETEDGIDLWRREYDGTWTPQYFFDLQARKFPDDYQNSCQYHQTSPNSSFARESVTSRATSEGRITLDTNYLTRTKNGRKVKRTVNNEGEYESLLKIHFGIEL